MENIRKIKVKILNKKCTPKVMQTGDAAFDLRSSVNFLVRPGETVKVPLGVAFKIPQGMCGVLTHRSSLAFKFGCTCSYGLIDSSFDGEVQALIINHSGKVARFQEGDRICQIRFEENAKVYLVEEEFYGNGKSGLGSSGGYSGEKDGVLHGTC